MVFRRVLVAILFVALLPLAASAQSIDDIARQIETLQKRVAELREQLRQTETVSRPTPTPAPVSAHSACVAATRDLSLSDTDARTGGEVSALQSFLARDSAIYPDALVTGFFGHLTEAAVKRYQRSKGILQTGFVGPLTRAAIAKDCGEGGSVSTSQYSFKASPTSGTAPLLVTFTATAAETKDVGVWYSVDFGDGSQGNMSASASDTAFISTSHTYTNGGSFNTRLLQNEDLCGTGQTYTYGCTRQLVVDNVSISVAAPLTPPALPPSPTPSPTPLPLNGMCPAGYTLQYYCPGNATCGAGSGMTQCVPIGQPSTTGGSCTFDGVPVANGRRAACGSPGSLHAAPWYMVCTNGNWDLESGGISALGIAQSELSSKINISGRLVQTCSLQ